MYEPDFIPSRHLAEFQRAVRNRHFSESPDGVLFPRQHAFIGGVMEIISRDGVVPAVNKVVKEGRNALLNALRGTALPSSWYVAPFAANVAVVDTLTAADFASTQTEFTNYSETNRQAWTTVASTAASLTNTASVAEITIDSGAQDTVYGAGILSAQAKSAVSGVLLCAALATTAKTGLEQDETLGFRYSLALNDA